MLKKMPNSFFAFLLAVILGAGPAHACTWAAFANGAAAVVVRTMDWMFDDDVSVKGYGRNMAERAADTPDGLEYVSKYASIRFHSFSDRIVAEAMNEKGLQGAILYLEGSELPPFLPGRADMSPNNFIAYAVASFATVQEVVDSLSGLNFMPTVLNLPESENTSVEQSPEKWPGHYAFADAGGDKAIIEFIGGEAKVYHGREHDAISNEPAYEIHLALDDIDYVPTGSIQPIDRRARARNNMRDMYERGVDSTGRALLAMRGVLASVTSGTEEIDRAENDVYPTLWGVVADQNGGRYYFSHIGSWCSEVYDFSMFAVDEPRAVTLEAPACPYGRLEVPRSE